MLIVVSESDTDRVLKDTETGETFYDFFDKADVVPATMPAPPAKKQRPLLRSTVAGASSGALAAVTIELVRHLLH